jgi:hypothetical protein
VRPRRLTGASARPRNLTVRRRDDGHHAARCTATTGEFLVWFLSIPRGLVIGVSSTGTIRCSDAAELPVPTARAAEYVPRLGRAHDAQQECPGRRAPIPFRVAVWHRAAHLRSQQIVRVRERGGDGLFLDLHHQLDLANEIFWGLWFIPFGLLVYKSRFLPRILGVWLIIACFGYLALSFTGLLFPDYEDQVSNIAQPLLLAELAIMLWLLIMGATEKPRVV